MESNLGVLRLAPVLVERPWGGRRLASYGKIVPDEVPIGESWEVADLSSDVAPHVADPRSRVVGGPWDGASLSDLIARFGGDLLGSAVPTAQGEFPLLVKLLDARQHLSVQVHPHAGYVSTHPESRLKTESWYVIDADDDAALFLDFRPGVDPAQVNDVMGTSDLPRLLRTVPAHPGDFHHLPAGLVHALGAGVLVAEIQTPSDTTFRMYDWSDEYGRDPRPLHLAQARSTFTLAPPDAFSLQASTTTGVRMLEVNPHYWIREHRADAGAIDLDTSPEVRVIMVVSGLLTVDDLEIGPGQTVIIPAVAAPRIAARMKSSGVVLEVGLGST